MKSTLLTALCALPLLAACQSDPSADPPARTVGPAAEPELVTAAIGQTRNVTAFGDVYLAGQPSPTDFEAARLAGEF